METYEFKLNVRGADKTGYHGMKTHLSHLLHHICSDVRIEMAHDHLAIKATSERPLNAVRDAITHKVDRYVATWKNRSYNLEQITQASLVPKPMRR